MGTRVSVCSESAQHEYSASENALKATDDIQLSLLNSGVLQSGYSNTPPHATCGQLLF